MSYSFLNCCLVFNFFKFQIIFKFPFIVFSIHKYVRFKFHQFSITLITQLTFLLLFFLHSKMLWIIIFLFFFGNTTPFFLKFSTKFGKFYVHFSVDFMLIMLRIHIKLLCQHPISFKHLISMNDVVTSYSTAISFSLTVNSSYSQNKI